MGWEGSSASCFYTCPVWGPSSHREGLGCSWLSFHSAEGEVP